jgi:Xaa-Pro dipeptidase
LFVTSGTTNFAYLAGARVERSERLIALVVPAADSAPPIRPVLVAPSFEVERMKKTLGRTGALQDATLVPWEEHENPFAVLRAALDAAAGGRTSDAAFLVEAHTEYGTAGALARATGGTKLIDGGAPLELLRAHKDEAELARIRHAIAITHRAFEAAFAALVPGVRDKDVAHAIGRDFEKAGVDGYALVQFGALSALPHGHPDGAALSPGTVVLIDGGCAVDGYWSDITRTRWFEGAGPRVAKDPAFDQVHAIVKKAQAAALAKVAPGVAAQEIDRAARAIITDAGYGPNFTHRVGHGLGMDGHEPVYLVEGNTTRLEEGFVFTLEPGIYLPGRFGVRIEDDVVCTRGGAVVL